MVGSPSTTTTLVPPKSASVGFNANKTEFVLPYNLGYLPAAELALTQADSAYAAGLGNAQDWTQQEFVGPGPSWKAWVYIGTSGNAQDISLNKGDAEDLGVFIKLDDGVKNPGSSYSSEIILHSSPVAVNASTLNGGLGGFGVGGDSPYNAIPASASVVDASNLEIQAAPVGTLAVGVGASLPAFCVPVPEAFVNGGGKLFNPSGFPVMTAGPSTVFGGAFPPAGNTGSPSLYDKGVASCNNFH